MAYSSYVTKISEYLNNFKAILKDIEGVDISSSWSGDASSKQISNLESILSGLDSQNVNLETLISVLNLIDEYDEAKRLELQYNIKIKNLNPSSESYNSDLQNYTRLRNEATEKKQSLKKQIEDLLNSINDRYNESLTDIPATEVVPTVDAFSEVDKISAEIDSSLSINNAVSGGTVIVNSTSNTSVNDGGNNTNSNGGTYQTYSTVDTSSSADHVVRNGDLINESNKNPNFSNRNAWVSNNPFAASGLYGQCTWFAWGRFYEIYGYSPGFTRSGKYCADQLIQAHPDKFYRSSDPVPGAIFSTGLNEKHGHVGIVIDVDYENDTITYQDGNYDGKTNSFAAAQSDWRTRTVSLSEFKRKRGGVIFACPKEGA